MNGGKSFNNEDWRVEDQSGSDQMSGPRGQERIPAIEEAFHGNRVWSSRILWAGQI